jgi:hypothetical protein
MTSSRIWSENLELQIENLDQGSKERALTKAAILNNPITYTKANA